MSNLLRSLALTAFLTSAAPMVLVGCLLAVLAGGSLIPSITSLSQTGATQVIEFLRIFGSGYPWQGLFTIGLTCGMVGCAFDFFNFYLYQSLRSH